MTDTDALVERYFQLAPSPDRDAYFAQFADDAVVEDEGHDHEGIEAIRDWRRTVPPVTYTVLSSENDGDGELVRAEVAGDFPGSPVTLAFRFTFAADGRITALAIRSQ